MSSSRISQPATLAGYEISTDKSRLDLGFVHDFLCNHSHWASGISRELVEKSVQHSLCFGAYHGQQQVGFGRVITDYTTFAYWCDVFVLDEHRGFGLARWLIAEMKHHPELQGLRKLALYTSRAHNFYRELGFEPITRPENWLELHLPTIYQAEATA